MTHGQHIGASAAVPAPLAELPPVAVQAGETLDTLELANRVAELKRTLDRVDRSLREARDAGCTVTERHRRVVADIGAARRLLGLISARLTPGGRSAH